MLQIKDYTSLSSFQNSRQLLTGVKSGTNDHVFIKIRSFDINEEARITSLLSDCLGFPHFFYYGVENNKSILITSQLGKSLQNLFYESNLRFSLKTLLMIIDQLLQRMEFLFHSGIIHGRISPEHILVDRVTTQNNPSTLYLINFEHSETFKSNFDTGIQVPFNIICQDSLSIANPIASNFDEIPLKNYSYDSSSNADDFLSASVLCKEELTPKSDLESLLYVIVYLFNHGKLPWSNEKSTVDHKVSILAEDLCAGMPEEFTVFAKMIKSLGPDDAPNYAEYRSLFRELFIRKKYIYDGIFDWNKQKIISFNFEDNFNAFKSASSNANITSNNSSMPIYLSSSPRMHMRSNPTFSRHSLTRYHQFNPQLKPRISQENPQRNMSIDLKDEKEIIQINDSQENEISINSDDLLCSQATTEQIPVPKHKSKHKHKHSKHMLKQIPNIDFGNSATADDKSDSNSKQGNRNKQRSSSLRIPQPPHNSSVPLFPTYNQSLQINSHSPSPSYHIFNAFKTSSDPIPDLHGFTYTMKQAQSAAHEYVSSLPKRGGSGSRGRSFSVNEPSPPNLS